MSRQLFGRLVDHVAQQGDSVANPKADRFIRRLSDQDAELMAKGSAKSLIVTRQIRMVRIEYDGRSYFCVFGLPESDEELSGLEIIPPTPGTFALSVLEGGVRSGRDVTSAQIKDVIDDAYIDNGQGYDGHELADVLPLFPSFTIYQTASSLEYHSITERVLGAILVRTYLDGPISLEPETVSILARVFEHDSALIPFRNLVQGVLSISWENLFVEVYRCVEQLYPLPRVAALKAATGAGPALHDLAKALEKHLGWYPREEDAFRALVLMCSEGIVSAMCAGLSNGQGDTHKERCNSAAKELYELRNRIVHYRPAHEVIVKSDADWNIVIRGMLEIVAHLYDAHGVEFFGQGQ